MELSLGTPEANGPDRTMTTAPAIRNTLAHPRCPIRNMGRSQQRRSFVAR
jgi:hypothetical protein